MHERRLLIGVGITLLVWVAVVAFLIGLAFARC